MQKLIKAVTEVMKECPSVGKNSEVSAGGSNTYKGVKDSDVKILLSKSMAKNGLVIFPTNVERETVHREYVDRYGKPKKDVFVDLHVTYTLSHESGESIEIQSIGHAIDSGDKAPAKAMTYAMKYALLYTFMVSASELDDTDETHSDAHQKAPAPASNKKELIIGSANWQKVVTHAIKNKSLGLQGVIKKMEEVYDVTPAIKAELAKVIK